MMGFQALDEKSDRYVELSGAEFNLAELDLELRESISELIRFYNWNPPYPQFKTYWRDDSSPVGVYLDPEHAANRLIRTIGKDLEKRLGIAQGRLTS